MRSVTRRLMLFFNILAALAIFVGGCTGEGSGTPQPTSTTEGEPKFGGELRTYWQTAFSYLDPQRSTAGADPFFSKLYTATLLDYAEDGSLLPYLAQSWSLPDAKTIVLKLRSDVKFHDGTAFDSAAVKFNIERGQAAETNTPVRSTYTQIEQVETPDPLTVILRLKSPDGGFAYNLATTSSVGIGGMVSPTAVQKWGKEFERHVVAAGPFEIEKYTPEVELVLKRNESFFMKDAQGKKLPYLDRVRFTIIPDATVAGAALESEQVDLARVIAQAQADRLKNNKSVTVSTLKGNALIFLSPFTPKPPLDNLDLRKAIAYAIDRDEIVRAEYGGHAQPAYTAFPSSMWAWDSTIQDYKYDPAKAKEHLVKAGYPNGIKLTAAAFKSTAGLGIDTVQAQLKRVGIDLTVDEMEMVTFQEKFRKNGEYDLGFAATPSSVDPSTLASKQYASGAFYNPGQPKVPEFDALIEKGRLATDRNERKKIYSDLQKAINARVHSIPLLYLASFSAYQTYVKGYTWGPELIGDIRWAWLDK
ncbi:MAG: ABC transporter substrate-binding protein [Chloroflexota bacterium]|nr:MAG: ABC transporter substrate-binding protein [Chloroflexota bacterium]